MTSESFGASQLGLRPDCDQVRRLVWRLLDEELEPQDASAMRTHLRECLSCRAVMRFERAFLSAMREALRTRFGEPSM